MHSISIDGEITLPGTVRERVSPPFSAEQVGKILLCWSSRNVRYRLISLQGLA